MNFSTLFRLRENLNLDKKTLVILRWIAIIGQLTAVNLVYFYLKLDFPVLFAHFILFFGFLTNSYLQFGIRSIILKDFYASIFLIYDLIQLTTLLYLTGGISNPFSILMIIPAIVSSTFLSMGTTIILGILTITLLFLLTTGNPDILNFSFKEIKFLRDELSLIVIGSTTMPDSYFFTFTIY